MVKITALIALALLACTPKAIQIEPNPEMAVEIEPPQQYNIWLQEVTGCVLFTAQKDTTFEVVRIVPDAGELTWIILSSERSDGTIPCIRGGIVYSCYGISHPDTIILSAQYARHMPTVKHEIMHLLVDSPRETHLGPHGPPWGFCEYLW